MFVSPSTIDRPSSVFSAPLQYTLRVQSKNMEFEGPDTDPSTDTETGSDTETAEHSGTTVAFRANPGLKVASVEVIRSDVLEATVLVYPEAFTRSSAMVVSSKGKQASARVTVRNGEGVPFLDLSPGAVQADAARQKIWMRAVDFSLEELQSLTCLENGCTIDSFEVVHVPSKAADDGFFWIALDSAALDSSVTTLPIRAVTSEGVVFGRFRLIHSLQEQIDYPQEKYIEAPTGVVRRGDTRRSLPLLIHGATFSLTTLPEVSFPPRSGVTRSREPELSIGLKKLFIEYNVAKDAPLGPVTVTVENRGATYETDIIVAPSGNGDENLLSFGQRVVSREDGRATVELTSRSVWDSSQTPAFEFDDPGVSLEGFERIDDSNGRVTLRLGPGARSTESVMYASGPAGKAAASIRVYEPRKPIFLAPKTPLVALARSQGKMSLHLRAVSEDWQWNPEGCYLPEVMEGIGVDVSAGRVDPTDSKTLVVDFSLLPTGPGGWLGIVVPMGDRLGIAYVQVLGDDQSLSMTFESPGLVAGDRDVEVTAVLPEALDLTDGPVEAFSENPNLSVRIPHRVSAMAPLRVDVAMGAPASVPVFVRGTVGAAVGIMQIEPLANEHWVDPQSEWVFLQAERKTINFAPTAFPAVAAFYPSGENPIDITLASAEAARPLFDTQPISPSLTSFVFNAAQASFSMDVKGASTLVGRALVLDAPAHSASMPIGPGDPCAQPFLARGNLKGAFDSHAYVFTEATSCETAFVVVARDASNQPWVTPDTFIELRGPDNLPLQPAISSAGWPSGTKADPTLYCPLIGTQLDIGTMAVLSTELSTAGEYLLNVRRPQIIREMSQVPGSAFIELEGKPGSSTDGLVLEVFDAQTDVPLASLALPSALSQFPDDGLLVVAGAGMSEADIVHEVGALPAAGGFAVALVADGLLIDAVQVGQTQGGSMGEGTPLESDSGAYVFARVGRIDTNDNSRDFIPVALATPGE
ncbi:MAG: hypothetical protein MUC50_21430 [Myxococcota bacterium]|nr:hypothetical protein [Myxococcota bacterium]